MTDDATTDIATDHEIPISIRDFFKKPDTHKWPKIDLPYDGRGICLVGMSMRTMPIAPFKETTDWSIFTLNNAHRFVPRVDMLSEMHSPEHVRKRKSFTDEDWKWLTTTKVPVISRRHYEEWPTSYELPIERLKEMFPRMPWTSSMAYMLAFAACLVQDGLYAPRIGIYGIDMLDDYSFQGPGFGYLIAKVESMGIQIVLPRGSAMFRQPFMYGYDEQELLRRETQLETRSQELRANIEQMQKERDELAAKVNRVDTVLMSLKGSLGENEYQRRHFLLGPNERE